MVFFRDTPIFLTGDSSVDLVLAGATITAILLSLAGVLGHLKAALAARRKHGQKRIRHTTGFLLLAVSSLAIVNYLRFEHHDTRIGNWQDLNKLREEWSGIPILGKEPQGLGEAAVSNIQEGVASATEQIPPFERITDGMKDAFGSGATAASHFASAIRSTGERLRKTTIDDGAEASKRQWHRAAKHLRLRAKDSAEEAADEAERKAQWVKQKFGEGFAAIAKLAEGDEEARLALKQQYPWLDEILYPHLSLWDTLKTVIGSHRHLWWTQQWFCGYMTWALFIGLECQHRGYQSHLALSLVIIGYTISLATAQSVFFALLLLAPVPGGRKGRATRLAQVWAIAIPMGAEMVLLGRLPGVAVNKTKSGGIFEHDIIQFLLAVIPAIGTEMLHVWIPRRYPSRRAPYFNPSDLRHWLALVWWSASILSLILYLNTTYWAYRETDPTGASGWWNVMLGHTFWLAKPETHVLHSIGSVLGSLGEHAWLNAIGWDVIFSIAAICGWAWVSAANVSAIFQCSLIPFDFLKMASATAGDKAMERAEPSLEMASETISAVCDRLEPYTSTAGEYISDLRDAAEPYLDQSKEWLEDAGANVGSAMERKGLTADRFADQAKQSLSSGYDALSTASSRTFGRPSSYLDNDEWEEEGEFKASRRSPSKRGRSISGSVRVKDQEKESGPRLRRRGSQSPAKRGRYDDSLWGEDQEKEDGPQLRRRSSRSPAKRGRHRGGNKSRSSPSEALATKLSGRRHSHTRDGEDGSHAETRSSRSQQYSGRDLLRLKHQAASKRLLKSRVSSAI